MGCSEGAGVFLAMCVDGVAVPAVAPALAMAGVSVSHASLVVLCVLLGLGRCRGVNGL